MKIAIYNNYVPFVRGGAELLAETLQQQLQLHGHQAIIVKIPFAWNPSIEISKSILTSKLYRSDFEVDRVIALKFPAYLVRHPNKIVWLLHQFRQAYDLWDTPFQDIPTNKEGTLIREMIISNDNRALNSAKKIYTNSTKTANRLKKFNNIDSEVLFPPPLNSMKSLTNTSYENYLFMPGRITNGKRQFLAVEAMKYTKTNIKLIVAGQPESQDDLKKLNDIIKKNNLSEKVTLIKRWISEDEKSKYFSNALGSVYIPYDEDSYGYVTMESCISHKAVITTNDSGDVSILVKNNKTGFVVDPVAKNLASVFDDLYSNRQMAKNIGNNAYEYMRSLNITWENVINKLTIKI